MPTSPAEEGVTEVGSCIYRLPNEPAHELPLREEHVVPLGLLPQGHAGWKLLHASCRPCEKITSAFEEAVLRRLWKAGRTGLGLRTRRKSEVPKAFPLLVERDEELREVLLPASETPVILQLPEYALPAYLDARPYTRGIDVNGVVTFQVAGPSAQSVGRKLGAKTLQFGALFGRGHPFERLLAKIAYCFAVAPLGLSGIEQAYVLPAILDRSDDIGRWLGCDGQDLLPTERLHQLALAINDGVILCRIRLFARFKAPEYVVIVGRAAQPG